MQVGYSLKQSTKEYWIEFNIYIQAAWGRTKSQNMVLTWVPLLCLAFFLGDSSVRSMTPSSPSPPSESDNTITELPSVPFSVSSSFSLRRVFLSSCSLSSARCSSGVSSASLARPCQLMALSVRHCSASPSGRRTGSLCRATSNARIVSRRGRRDRWHRGHKKRESQSHQQRGFTGGPEEGSREGKGTQPPWNQSLHRWQRSWGVRGWAAHTHTDWGGVVQVWLLLPFSFREFSEWLDVSVSMAPSHLPFSLSSL